MTIPPDIAAMNPSEIVTTILGALLTVYIPMLIKSITRLKEEFHRNNVLNERRLMKLETVVQLLWANLGGSGIKIRQYPVEGHEPETHEETPES